LFFFQLSTNHSGSANKRTRLESVTSNKSNQKKRKEVLHDDDIEEILPEKKSIEKTGLYILKDKFE
jgi:hypothetical protein